MDTIALKELLTVAETAELLGVSKKTVRRRVRDGSLPAVRLGGAPHFPIRIPQSELRTWLYEPESAA